MLAAVNEQKRLAIKQRKTTDVHAIITDVNTYLQQQSPEEWRKTFTPLIGGVIKDQGERLSAQFGLSFDVQNVGALRWFKDYTYQFSQPINQTTQDGLNKLFQQALLEGWSVPTMQDNIGTLFDQWMNGGATANDFDWYEQRMPAYRLEMIARTEVLSASNFGAYNVMVEAGVKYKEWLATNDDRTREAHIIAGQDYGEGGTPGPIPIDQPFYVDNEALDYAGDPGGSAGNVINCRCTVIPADYGYAPASDSTDTTLADQLDLAETPDYQEVDPATFQQEWEPFIAGLSDSERWATREYIGGIYDDINNYLRGLSPLPSNAESAQRALDVIQYVDSTLDKNALAEDLIAYRSSGAAFLVGKGNPDLTNEQFWNLPGQTFTDLGYTSTTVSPDVWSTGYDYRLEVLIPAGTPGAYINQISYFDNEKEFLLASGTTFGIVGVDLRESASGRKQRWLTVEVLPSGTG